MKRTLLLVSLILVAYTVSGQQHLKNTSSSNLIKQKIDKSLTMATTTLRLTSSLFENWLATGVWENNVKTELTYGTNTVTEISSSWDNSTTGVWVLSSKSETTTDASGNVTLILYSSYNGSQWINTTKHEKLYNSNSDIIKFTISNWNGVAWGEIWKTEYTYDAGNNLTNEILFFYNSGTLSWDNSTKRIYIYTDGKNSQILSYTWASLPTNDWVISQKNNYTYDGSGKLTRETSFKWDGALALWAKSDSTETGYDAAGNMNLNTSYSWNNGWYPNRKLEYVYDADKNITLNTTSVGDALNWVFKWKSELTYTTNQVVSTNYGWVTGAWVYQSRETYNYSDVTAVEKHTESGIKVYPNSTGDNIIVENAEGSRTSVVQIFDLQGRKVVEQKLPGERLVVDTGGLKNGIYLYKITVNGKITSGKIMIK